MHKFIRVGAMTIEGVKNRGGWLKIIWTLGLSQTIDNHLKSIRIQQKIQHQLTEIKA